MSTNIEWTEDVWNPLAGCNEISPGCLHCYAATMAHRLAAMAQADIAAGRDPGSKRKYIGTTKKLDNGKIVWTGKVNLDPDALQEPLKRKKPTTYFVNSMSDLFHEDVPDEFIRRAFAVMSFAGQHTFQVLTKRARRLAQWFSNKENSLSACQAEFCVRDGDVSGLISNTRAINGTHGKAVGDGNYWPLPNVWLGVSVEDQKRLIDRWEFLRNTPAMIRFFSAEPLLGPLNMRPIFDCMTKPDWVIAGGESGHGARPCNVQWIRDIVQQCKAAGVPVFVKQLGGNVTAQGLEGRISFRHSKGGDMAEWSEDLRVREMPERKGVSV